MKKSLRYLATAAVLSAAPLASCNDKLNIEPINSVDATKALQTSDDVRAALVGSYDALSGNQLYGGYIQFIAELLGDAGDINFVGTFTQPRDFITKNIIVDNSFAAGVWLSSYRTINNTNNVLANTSKVITVQQGRVEGEAKFIRSAVYFELVRLYARSWNDGNPQTNPGVPLVLTPTTTISPASQVKRNTVAEVYAQVITDLIDAEAKLPVSNGFFANKGAAGAMLARVYLQQGRFAEAAAAANRVIASNRFPLVSSVFDEFGTLTNTTEDIFAVQITTQDGLNDLNTYYSSSQRQDIEVSDAFIGLYGATDDRGELFDDVFTTKFDNQYGNIKVIRSAEMFLIRAEANLRAGTTVGATPLADINRVRNRAGATPLAAVTINNVLFERRLELAFEGFRIHDLRRLGRPVGPLPFNSPKLILPIPQRERDVNPNLEQNEAYK